MAEVVNSPEVQQSAYINANLSEDQVKARNKRNVAISAVLIAWVVLVFIATIVRLGENALSGVPMSIN